MNSRIIKNRQLRCHNCSGEMKYDIRTNKLICSSCGSKVDVTSFGKSKIKLYDATSHIDTHFNILNSVDVVRCKSCGGTEIIDSNSTYGKCSFCDSSFVITETVEGVNVPKYMIPFEITEEQAISKSVEHLKKKNRLRFGIRMSVKSAKNITPIFQPTWVFSANLTTTYLEYYNENGSGGERKGTDTSRFNYVCATGSSHKYNVQLNRLKYDFSKEIERFNPDYTCGYPATINSLSVFDAFKLAKYEMQKETAVNLVREKPIYNVPERFDYKYENVMCNIVLTPAWITTFTFRSKTCALVVNGQTGEVVGNVPRNRILFLIIIILIAITGYFVYSNYIS